MAHCVSSRASLLKMDPTTNRRTNILPTICLDSPLVADHLSMHRGQLAAQQYQKKLATVHIIVAEPYNIKRFNNSLHNKK